MRRFHPLSIVVAFFFVKILVVTGHGELAAHDIITSRYDYYKDVLPIFRDHCSSCHHSRGPAPFALTVYEEARPRAVAIRQEVLAERMPPWHAAAGEHELRDEHHLSAREIDIVLEWAAGGAPEGKLPEPEVGGALTVAAASDEKKKPLLLEFPAITLREGQKSLDAVTLANLPSGAPPNLRSWSWIQLRDQPHRAVRGVELYRQGPSAANYLGSRLSSEDSLRYPDDTAARVGPKGRLALAVRLVRPWNADKGDLVLRPRVRLWLDDATPANWIASVPVTNDERPPVPGARYLGARPLAAWTASHDGSAILTIRGEPEPWPRAYLFREPIEPKSPLEIGVPSSSRGKELGIWLRSIPVEP